jgi:hypothetical protein
MVEQMHAAGGPVDSLFEEEAEDSVMQDDKPPPSDNLC